MTDTVIVSGSDSTTTDPPSADATVAALVETAQAAGEATAQAQAATAAAATAEAEAEAAQAHAMATAADLSTLAGQVSQLSAAVDVLAGQVAALASEITSENTPSESGDETLVELPPPPVAEEPVAPKRTRGMLGKILLG